VNDYILKVGVWLVDHTGIVKHGPIDFYKWVRFPQCPQVGWVVWNESRVEEITMTPGMFGVVVEVDGFRCDSEKAVDLQIEDLQTEYGFQSLDSFDFSGPPR
jgi:hypothetical protein